jgi:hypothetical protein
MLAKLALLRIWEANSEARSPQQLYIGTDWSHLDSGELSVLWHSIVSVLKPSIAQPTSEGQSRKESHRFFFAATFRCLNSRTRSVTERGGFVPSARPALLRTYAWRTERISLMGVRFNRSNSSGVNNSLSLLAIVAVSFKEFSISYGLLLSDLRL